MVANKEYFRERRLRLLRDEYQPAYKAFMECYPLTLEDLPDEEWRAVPKLKKCFVSNYGRVKSFANYLNGKILRPRLNAYGYLVVRLFNNKKWRDIRVHRLVATAFIPNPLNKPEVNHLHGRFNNHVSNLEWATGAENQRHAVATGLKKSGEDHPSSKLTSEQVLYIRENPDGLTGRRLAKMFGVPPQRISKIQLGKTWKNEGGTIRDKIDKRIPDSVREKICREYVYGSHEFGSNALAKKYGVTPKTILKIVKEGDRK